MPKTILFLAVIGIFVFTSASYSQTQQITDVQNTPVYKMLVSHKLAVQLKLKELNKHFTADFPTVQKAQYELDITLREMAILSQIPPQTLAMTSCEFGSKLISKIRAETQLRQMLTDYTDTFPGVAEQVDLLSKINADIEQELKSSN